MSLTVEGQKLTVLDREPLPSAATAFAMVLHYSACVTHLNAPKGSEWRLLKEER